MKRYSMSEFKHKVLAVVKAIPRGSTLSYKQVAQLAGYPQAQRAVGALMKKNDDPAVPCHRVIRSDGSLGGYNGGVEKKRSLLNDERALCVVV